MKVCITGGAGFIGSILIGKMLSRGYQVVVFDKLEHGVGGLLPYLGNPNLQFIKGDVKNREAVKKAIGGVDVVYPLAGVVGYPACRRDPQLAYEVNYEAIITVADALKDQMLIFPSTNSIYGEGLEGRSDGLRVCKESDPVMPMTEYGKSKAKAEDYLQSHKQGVILRLATAFGYSPRLRLDLLINDFTFQAVKRNYLVVYESWFKRTFVHVKDIADAMLFAFDNYRYMKGQIYNVGNDALNLSKKEVADAIVKKTGCYLHLAEIGTDADKRNYGVSTDRMNVLGWKAKIGLDEGLNELIAAYRAIEIPNPYSNA